MEANQCERCKKILQNAFNLKRHKNKKTPCDTKVELKCERCQKVFTLKHHLARHLNNKKPCPVKLPEALLIEREKTRQLELLNRGRGVGKSPQELEIELIYAKIELLKIERIFQPIEIKIAEEDEAKVCSNPEGGSQTASDFEALIEDNRKKDNRIRVLSNKVLKKRPRVQYTDQCIKIGMTKDLTSRLSTYNTGGEHVVLFHQTCGSEENMILAEKLIQNKLDYCRVQANRELFVGDPSHLEKIIRDCINFILC